jgi:hypothetical protein
VGQSDLDLLAADHDRPAGRDPAGDDDWLGQAGRLGSAGAGSAEPGPGLGRDGAGDGAGQDPGGQVAGVEPGRQGLDAVAVEQDVDLVKPGPEPDGAAGHAPDVTQPPDAL